jgi:hypothetical protein
MKTLRYIKRLLAAAVVAVSIGLAVAPRAQASATLPTTPPSGPVFDGNESHGKG